MKFLKIIVVLLLIQVNAKAQELTMFPGFWSYKYYQDDKQISKAEFVNLLSTVPAANDAWKKSKQHMGYGWLALGAEFGFLIWQLNRADNRESQTLPFIGVLGSAAVAIGFTISSGNLKKRAVLEYNKSLKDQSFFNIGLTPSGVGIAVSF